MNYKEVFKNEVLCEIKPHNFNYNNSWDCEFNRLLNLDKIYETSTMKYKLTLSLMIFLLNRKYDNGEVEILCDPNIISYKYITNKSYYDRLKTNDIKTKNSFNLPKKPWTKYEAWKKDRLIDHIHMIEKLLWNRTFIIRKYEEKYEGISLGTVMFD